MNALVLLLAGLVSQLELVPPSQPVVAGEYGWFTVKGVSVEQMRSMEVKWQPTEGTQFLPPLMTLDGEPVLIFRFRIAGEYSISVEANSWHAKYEQAMTEAAEADVDAETLRAMTDLNETHLAKYPVLYGTAVLEVAEDPFPNPEPGPTPNPGPRRVILLRESKTETLSLKNLILDMRGNPTWWETNKHQLEVVDPDQKDATNALPVVAYARRHSEEAEVGVPCLLVADVGLDNPPLCVVPVPKTFDDVKALIKKHGG